MTSAKQGFPDDRDRLLQSQADDACSLADDLVEWAGKFTGPRSRSKFPIGLEDEFSLYRLRRLATNLARSSNVPVAAAVYGASQVGKSLFMGRVLEPADDRDSPLGQNDALGAPAYLRRLSFTRDLNPQSGSNEATALVTRFTTKERFDEQASPKYPVKVRALSRSEWLRVLARGFRSECQPTVTTTWREGQLRDVFEEVARNNSVESVDREWRMDLLDVYAYLRSVDPRMYDASEAMFNAFLSRYPLSEAGYVELAGRLFWEARQFPTLTALFVDVCRFLKRISEHGRDGILIHWAAVRFLLDSQRSPVQESPQSQWQQRLAWSDLRDRFEDGWYVLDHEPGGPGPSESLAVIQAAMLEMIIPVIPHRLNDDWRDVLLKMDVLDLPGLRAGGGDGSGGATTLEAGQETMNVVKRGKVFYLIDRYLEERQVQTLLLLVRGGNLEVRRLIKDYVDKWGRARYDERAWPTRIPTDSPALFIGLTGIDDEFEKRSLNKGLYDARLNQLASETLYEVMTDFGGPGQPFTNVFPVRYPGAWDADLTRRKQVGEERWTAAGEAFLASPLVRKYVRDPEERWRAAMTDGDGGLSLICKGLIAGTTSIQKQDALHEQLKQVQDDLRLLAKKWLVDVDANHDRLRRDEAARKVLAWLDDAAYVCDRIHALRAALCFNEGDAMEIAEIAEQRASRSHSPAESLAARFPAFLKSRLERWAVELTRRRWREHVAERPQVADQLTIDEFGAFTNYLHDYLLSEGVFEQLAQRLLSVVGLPISDAADRRRAQREYVSVILNDYVLNPGPDGQPWASPEDGESQAGDDDARFSVMEPWIARWKQRLPAALASAAGEHVEVPPGNDELKELIADFS